LTKRFDIFETRVEGFSGTLTDLLEHLKERYGFFLTDLYQAESADLLSALIIMINGRHIAHVGGLNAFVAEGDIVTIFPLVGGG